MPEAIKFQGLKFHTITKHNIMTTTRSEDSVIPPCTVHHETLSALKDKRYMYKIIPFEKV